MENAQTKRCKDCKLEWPETREFFGQYKNKTKNGIKIGFRNSCRDCMAKNTADHSSKNPDLVKARIKRRKEQEKKSSGFYTERDIQAIRNELSDSCRFCGKDLSGGGEVEHLTPISRGGSNYPQNITLACLNCNREKTNKTLDEYMNWRQERKLHIRNVSVSAENPDIPTTKKGRKTHEEEEL